MSASILEEALAENEQLRKELSTLKEKLKKQNVEELSVDFVNTLSSITNLGMEGKKLKIAGIMLAEGVWNGLPYVKSEIKKMYERYKDKLRKLPITVEHEKTEEFKSRKVGETASSEWDDMLGAIKYEGYITDPKAIEMVKDGTFPATSMKLQVKRLNINGREIGTDYEPINLSLTSMPACKSCVIVSKEALSSNLGTKPHVACYFTIIPIEKDKSNGNKGREEVESMSESEQANEPQEGSKDKEEYFELSEPMVALLPEEDLEDQEEEVDLEFVPISDLAQVLKRKRVIYEYYPPGKYPTTKKTVKRRKGYYYYYPYYGYPYYYPYYGYGLSEDTPDLSEEELEELVKRGKARKKKSKTGNYYYYYYPGYYVPYYYYHPYYAYSEGTGPRTEKERLIAHFGKEKAEKLLELIGDLAYKLLPPRGTGGKLAEEEIDESDLEEISKLADYKIVKNKKTGKFIVMKASEKGLWKIVKQFDTEKEARDFVANLNLEAIADMIMKKLSKKIEEKELKKVKCPVCGEEFDSKEEMIEHFNKEHSEKYGKYGEGKYPEKQSGAESSECSPDNTSLSSEEQKDTQGESNVESEAGSEQPKEEGKEQPTETSKEEPKETGKEATDKAEEEKQGPSKEEAGKEEGKQAPSSGEQEVPKTPTAHEVISKIVKSEDAFGTIADILIEDYYAKAKRKI